MNLKNLFRLSTIVFLFTIVISSLSYGQTVRYLNSTDGDDSYTGENPTNNPLGTGPMRTLEGAFSAFADGATVYMAAGSYHFPGGAGITDLDGYVFTNIPPAAGKSMTFIVQTYNSNNVVTLDGTAGGGADGFKLDIGTGTLKFQPTTAGVQSVVLNTTGNANNLNLLSGTLDISAMGTGFTIGANYTVINVTAGTIVGSPTFSTANRTLNYLNTASLVAGGEVPSLLGTLNLSTVGSRTVTFNSAINFGYTGGGIFTTTTSSGTFNGALLFYDRASEAAAVNASTPQIRNNNTGTLTFAGGVTFRTTKTANDPGGSYAVHNASTGKIIFNGSVSLVQFDAGGTAAGGPFSNNTNHVSTFYNALGGTLTLQGGVSQTATSSDATGPGVTSDYTAIRMPRFELTNNSTGIVNLGGATVTTNINGVITFAAAAGTVNINGPVTFSNVGDAAATTTNFTNGTGATIALGSNTLTITKTGAVLTNNGNITSSGLGSGLLVLNVSGATTLTETAGTGQLPNLQKDGAGLLTVHATTLNGNVTSNRGGITFAPWTGTNVTCTNGLLTINTPSAGTNVVTSAPGTTLFKGLTMTGGGYTLQANSTTRLTGDYTQNGGTLTWGATSTLNCKTNFVRNSGAVVVGAGSDLQFTGGVAQTFSGGTNMTCFDFATNTTNTVVNFVNGSLVVQGDCKIVSNTTVNCGTYNIVMLGTAAGANTFTNTGNLQASGGGGLIFKGPYQADEVTPNGVGYFNWTGNGTTANIEIRLANPANFVDIINTESGQVNFSGVLTLTSGTVRINAGNSFNPTNLFTTSTIRRNMANNLGGAPDGQPITPNGGTFNLTNNTYNLEYFSVGSTAAGPYNVGPEFVIGATPKVINLTVSATTGAVNFPVAGLYSFSGNLSISNGASISLAGVSGTDDLVSTGTGVSHTINGSITGTADFALNGTGTVTGGTGTTDASSVARLTSNTTSTTYNVNNLKQITTLTTNSGVTNLAMQAWTTLASAVGTVANFNLQGGTLNLTADAKVSTSFVMVAGATFDFMNQNLYVTGGGVAGVTGGTFLATGASTKGWLLFTAAANLSTGTVLVPKIQIQNGVTVTMTGNSGMKDTFQDYDATPTYGTLAMGTRTFVMGGTTWNAGGTYTGTGLIQVTGATNVNLAQSINVPNFELKNTTNTCTLVNNTGTATPPSITVPGVFTSTSGNLALGAQDFILTGTTPFTYVAGAFTATTSNTITATDNANGEFVFDNVAAQTFSVTATGLSFPNVRVNNTGNMTLAATPNNVAFAIANRLVLANTGDLVVATDGKLTIGDGCLIKRMDNAGILDKVPTFAGTVDNQYTAAAGPIVQAKEANATLRNLFVNNTAGVNVSSSKNVTVTGTLYLYTGNYDFEAAAGTIYTITMGSGALVNVRDGNLVNSGSTTVTPLAGGPVILTYSNTLARTISNREYPTTAGFVSTLNVNSNDGAGGAKLLTLNADHSCGDFVLATGNSTTPINTCRFDLNGKTLTVTNTSSATLTRGILSSEVAPVAPATFNAPATLSSAGSITSAAAASIQNVNLSCVTLTLAGPFGQTAYGAATTTNVTSATVSGVSSIAAFNGNLTGTGNISLTGAHTNGTITASADVTVGTGGSMAATSFLAFIGTANATLTVPSAGATIGGLTLAKTNNTNTVTLAGGNIRTTALTTFTNGLFVTGANTFNMWVPGFGGGQGFTRAGVTGTNISHVVGNLAKTLFNGGGNPGTSCEPRQEFPVGTTTLYRSVAVTFNPSFGLATTPNATLTVNSFTGNPGGAVALPIKDGVATGIDVARYPNFYWTIASSPFSIGPTTPFDLELTAAGFTDFDAIANVRIIRRHGAVADVSNDWLLQGTNSSYDNSMNGTTPTVIQRQANAGLRVGGAVFTLGMKSNISLKPGQAIPKQWLVIQNSSIPGSGPKTYLMNNRFQGNVGALSYTAQTSNASVATVTAVGYSVTVTPVAIGDCVITVIASDAANNDFFAISFPVNVGLTDVDENAIPTEFALYQNFPNPFNPTTNIKFALPKESNVTLKVYNILGQEVATLVNKVMPAGYHTVDFDATKISSGMYIYRIEAGDFVQVKKMLLMK